MDEVAEDGLVLGIAAGVDAGFGAVGAEVFAGGQGHVDDGTGGVAALADEGLLAGLHVGEVVGDEEELDGGFVGILDHDL